MQGSLREVSGREFAVAEMPAVCRGCEARLDGICGAMSAAQLAELNRFTSRKRIGSGTELHGQGEAVLSYANILKGVVKLSKVMADGRQQIVGLQFAPDFIGRPFSAESSITAEAATDVEVCAMSKPVLDRLVTENSGLGSRLHNQALSELDEARDWMLTLGRKTARERVASLLHLIASHYDPETSETVEFDLPLSRQDIGDFLGLTIETVSRQMTKLRQDGVIRVVNNRHVTVSDMEHLAEIAGIDLN